MSGPKARLGLGGRKAYTLVELVVVVGIIMVMVLVGLPFFTAMMRNSRVDAAVRQLTSDVRETRSRATLTGWQYRLVSFNYGGSSTYKNQYRLIGRSSTGVAWPADTGPSFEGATQMAGAWININTLYPGVKLNPAIGTASTYVSFDARGVAFEIDAGFNPLTVTNDSGATKTVTVSSSGSVKIQ